MSAEENKTLVRQFGSLGVAVTAPRFRGLRLED
jgi:hypothetical protein